MIEVKREHIQRGILVTHKYAICDSEATTPLAIPAMGWCKALNISEGDFGFCTDTKCAECGLAQIHSEMGNVTEQSINQQLKDFGVVIVTSEQG